MRIEQEIDKEGMDGQHFSMLQNDVEINEEVAGIQQDLNIDVKSTEEEHVPDDSENFDLHEEFLKELQSQGRSNVEELDTSEGDAYKTYEDALNVPLSSASGC
jgi:hypothetical protein